MHITKPDVNNGASTSAELLLQAIEKARRQQLEVPPHSTIVIEGPETIPTHTHQSLNPAAKRRKVI